MVSVFKWIKNVSIAKKLYFTVGIMALLIFVELFALFFSLNTLSSVRAYVGAEGLWSKAQKDAVFHLYKYGVSHNEEDYILFNEFMKVPLGDGKTRQELFKEHPDLTKARNGFIEGRNHPDDINGMINLFKRFNKISYIAKAIEIWGEAEPVALMLIPISTQLHKEIKSGTPSQEKINRLLREMDPINKQLTKYEDDFSYTLGEGSRWLEGIVLKLLFSIALTVEITGLLLAVSVSRGIQKSISEILSASFAFSKGNLKIRAEVFSGDEIGVLANSFNHMSDELEKNIAELEKSQEKFRRVLESAPNAMIVFDKKNGTISLVNHQTKTLFGYKGVELIGNNINVILPQKINEHILLSKSKHVAKDLIAVKKNGEQVQVEITFTPIETTEEDILLASIVDVTEKNKQEIILKRQLELEAKNKELEQFAYAASHDLQEPLRTVTNCVQIFEEEYADKLDKSANEYLSYIGNATKRMRELVKALLNYSRLGKNKTLSYINCKKLIDEVLEDLKTTLISSGAQVHVDEMPVMINGYEIEMRQLFQNLISNAIKFKKKDTIPKIEIRSERMQDKWKFSVKDNGIGIKEVHFDRIFNIFQRLHNEGPYEGYGIGLANCKKIVELHGGEIWLESIFGEGTTFYFTISNH